jgi:hypothetical protein
MRNRGLPVNYGNCLFVSVSRSGIRLSILFLFRFQSPPLFLPWVDVESVTERRLLFLMRYSEIILKGDWPRLSLYGAAGRAARRYYAAHAEAVSAGCAGQCR